MSYVVDPASGVHQFVSDRNLARQYDFIHTSFMVYQFAGGQPIDHEFICTLNAYATRYLSPQPGQYRRHYDVEVGAHQPSPWPFVHHEMQDFLDVLHYNWAKWSAVELAAYALWGVNHIHPFCDGNGRTARALSYYILCIKLQKWLPGDLTVVEQLRTNHRSHHCEILQRMHNARQRPEMKTDLGEMAALIDRLALEQVQAAAAAKQAAAELAEREQATATTSIQLAPDVIQFFRSEGNSWQLEINEILRRWAASQRPKG